MHTTESSTVPDTESLVPLDGPVVESGIDVVSISRIGDLRESDHIDFVERVFTDDEIEYCEGSAHPAEHYAARWCVKEAVKKIVDRAGRVPFREVAVAKEGPKPVLSVSGTAREELAATIGTTLTDERVDTAVSLSHDRTSDTAVGVVTILGRDRE